MPSLSPTMEKGKIVKWLKKEGDTVNPGDVLCDIETDKAIVSMEIEEEGILAKILIPENTPDVKVGSIIALMVAEGEDWKNVEVPSGAEVSTSRPESKPSSSPSGNGSDSRNNQEPPRSEPSPMKILMPSLSPTMTTGTIVKWLKKEGDAVAPGVALCEIQTDKAVITLEAEEEGILAKILLPDDSKDVKIGTLIALVVGEGEDWKNVTVPSQHSEKREVLHSELSATRAAKAGEVGGKKFGPAVKSLLAVYQIDPGHIKPTGKSKMLLKEDVLKYISDNKLEKRPPEDISASSSFEAKPPKPESVHTKKFADTSINVPKYKNIEISNIRQTIANRLLQAKREIPHLYATIKCNVDDLLIAKKFLSTEGINVSVNDLLTKAVALALKIYPRANALFINNEVKLAQTVDISMAVATPKGLFTPIIKNANEKNVFDISQEIKELAAKAKAGRLKPEEYQGGTFTISNLGMFGITHFKAIINPPQCGILAVGGSIVNLESNLRSTNYITLTLSCDARSMQDKEAAEFMEILKYFIENPKLITRGLNVSMNISI